MIAQKIPISFCLFTSTKGHFDIKTRYQETIKSFDKELPLANFANLIVHIKVGSTQEDNETLKEMESFLTPFGFKIIASTGEWKHGDSSHQVNYIRDMTIIYSMPELQKTPYVFHVEDDWLLGCNGVQFISVLKNITKLFDMNPDLVQVRIPRFSNEFDRINGLKEKHGINGIAKTATDSYFFCNDYSMNPSFFRSRDIRCALTLLHRIPNVEIHVEHGLGRMLKLLSFTHIPFAVLNPDKVRIAHIGTPIGQEDSLTQPTIAT